MPKKTTSPKTKAAPKAAEAPNPTELPDRDWLYAVRKKGTYPKPTDRSGKWLIFVPVEKVDALWKKVRAATEEGQLGDRSRVATGKEPTPWAEEPDSKVIAVYTYDSEDKKDVMRIREKLRTLGFKQELHYKTDADTAAGNYTSNIGHKVDKFTS
jgi:hypothetical protein